MEEIIKEINKEAFSIQEYVLGWPVRPIKRRSNKKSYIQLILENYDQVALILERIGDDQAKLSELHLTHMKLGVEKTSDSIKNIIKYNNLIALDIESLYVWSAKIKDLFEKYKASVNLKELIRISIVRHKFMTHLTNSDLFKKSASTRLGIRYNMPGVKNVEILLHPTDISKRELPKLKKIVEKASQFIPELKKESNYWEQLHILFRNINIIKDPGIKGDADKLISRLGVATDPPEYIGEILLKCLKDFKRTKCRRK